MRMRSFGRGSPGFHWGYVGMHATHKRPLLSKAIWTGLASSGNSTSEAKRLTLKPGAVVIAATDSSGVRYRSSDGSEYFFVPNAVFGTVRLPVEESSGPAEVALPWTRSQMKRSRTAAMARIF